MDETTPLTADSLTGTPADGTGSPPQAASTGEQPPAATFSDTDINALAPELQSAYKRLQADYTRKTQEIAARGKDLDAWRTKADQLDSLTADPRFQSWYAGQAAGSGPATADQTAEGAGQEYTPDQMAEILTNPKKFREAIQSIALHQAQEMVKPVADKAERIVADRTVDAFAASHADYETYREAMIPYVTKGYALEDAYRLTKWSVLERDATQKALADAKAKATQSVGGAGAPASSTSRPGRKMTIEEAADLALQSLSTTRR